jgi:hypothetical protein
VDTVFALCRPWSAVLSAKRLLTGIPREKCNITHRTHIDITPTATISTPWPASVNELFLAPTNNTIAAATCFRFNGYFINKHDFSLVSLES